MRKNRKSWSRYRFLHHGKYSVVTERGLDVIADMNCKPSLFICGIPQTSISDTLL